MKLYEQFKKDIIKSKSERILADRHNNDEYELERFFIKRTIKQSYLNAIDVMIKGSEKAEIESANKEARFGYNIAHNEVIGYLKAQRKLIEDYE